MAEIVKDTCLQGLTSAEAVKRLVSDGPNELPVAKKRNLVQQTIDVLREPMLLLLLGAGTINFILAEPFDGIVLMAFVLVVIGIEIYQEHKTENALAALRDLSAPRALVLRDGQRVRIAGRDVVRGDYLLLDEGDRVPADAVLLECVNISVDESALTGESVPVRKSKCAQEKVAEEMGRPGGDATPWVYSGTLVVKGTWCCVCQRNRAWNRAWTYRKGLKHNRDGTHTAATRDQPPCSHCCGPGPGGSPPCCIDIWIYACQLAPGFARRYCHRNGNASGGVSGCSYSIPCAWCLAPFSKKCARASFSGT